ncbi:MAG: RHS repeat-associated core domain-containing protein [Dysgonomonas sp.]
MDAQPYKYNGKEQDRKLGLNLYDYSARQMDNAVPRFTSVDPHAEKYYSTSPYVYCANNPIKYIDPTGMEYGD